MPRLVGVFEDAGLAGVWTYVNSGNVVFEAEDASATLEGALQDRLQDALGLETTTFLRTATELRTAVTAEPFGLTAGDTYFLTFLKSRTTTATRRALEDLTNDFDTLVVAGRTVHWRMRGKSTESRLTTKDWERIVGRHQSTSRNITMLRRLLHKIDS